LTDPRSANKLRYFAAAASHSGMQSSGGWNNQDLTEPICCHSSAIEEEGEGEG